MVVETLKNAIRDFLRLESASGLLLVAATILAMVIANSPASTLYQALLDTPFGVRVGALEIAKPLLLWVNDGLMAIFFFLIGLEIKREVLDGELSNPQQVILPLFGAVGGMLVPAAIYAAFNWNDPVTLQGWAIPAATDIAFALGVLSLLGKRVPTSLKLFLMTLAIADDLGAILIIALFYTSELSTISLTVAGGALCAALMLNRSGVLNLTAYSLVGLVLWVAVLKSGVHATLAGVLMAFFIPLRAPHSAHESPLLRLEHDLHPFVAYAILPLFAFVNTGISLHGFTPSLLLEPVPLGIVAGLFLGKQFGVFGFAWIAIRTGLAQLPTGARWLDLYGIAILCGIGFTMSLFISSLAFGQDGGGNLANDRLGILLGSLLSAGTGYALLNHSLSRPIDGS